MLAKARTLRVIHFKMFVSFLTLSLATTLYAQSSAALDIDVKDQGMVSGVTNLRLI